MLFAYLLHATADVSDTSMIREKGNTASSADRSDEKLVILVSTWALHS